MTVATYMPLYPLDTDKIFRHLQWVSWRQNIRLDNCELTIFSGIARVVFIVLNS